MLIRKICLWIPSVPVNLQSACTVLHADRFPAHLHLFWTTTTGCIGQKPSIFYFWFKGITLVFLVQMESWILPLPITLRYDSKPGFMKSMNEFQSLWTHDITCKILCVCLFSGERVHPEVFFGFSKKAMMQTRRIPAPDMRVYAPVQPQPACNLAASIKLFKWGNLSCYFFSSLL